MHHTDQATIVVCANRCCMVLLESNYLDFNMTRPQKMHFAWLCPSCSSVHRCEMRAKRMSAAAKPTWQKCTLICTEVNDFTKSTAAGAGLVSSAMCKD